MKNTMRNTTELRTELAGVFMSMKEGTRSPRVADVMCNCAGKIISSVRLDLDYKDMTNGQHDINFLMPVNETEGP